MKRFVFTIATCLAVMVMMVSCAETPTPDEISDVVITLERGPCFGACPVYKLTVYGD